MKPYFLRDQNGLVTGAFSLEQIDELLSDGLINDCVEISCDKENWQSFSEAIGKVKTCTFPLSYVTWFLLNILLLSGIFSINARWWQGLVIFGVEIISLYFVKPSAFKAVLTRILPLQFMAFSVTLPLIILSHFLQSVSLPKLLIPVAVWFVLRFMKIWEDAEGASSAGWFLVSAWMACLYTQFSNFINV